MKDVPPADRAGVPAPVATDDAALPRWRVFPVLAMGTLMATLDISVVNIALPTLSRTFRVPLTTVEWVVLAYVVAITGLLVPMGRLADGLGRRRVYGGGLVVFSVGSVLCALSPSSGALVGSRVAQGVGAAMMSATRLALLTTSFPASERGRAIGAFGAAVGVGLALGPPLGGLVVQHASWRWIFLINVPIGLAALVLLGRRLPADPRAHQAPRADPAGMLASASALTALMLALSRGPELHWRGPLVWSLFGAALALATGFVLLEARSESPLLPLDVLRGGAGPTLLLTLIGQMLSMSVGFYMPLYLEEVLGLDAGATGRWLAVVPLAALVLAPLAGRWADRVGSRPFTTGGLVVVAAGLAALAGLGMSPGPGHLFAGLLLVGCGLGLFTVANSSALMGTVPARHLGTASGLQAVSRNLGIATGSALTAALATSRFIAHGGPETLTAGTLTPLLVRAFALATRDTFAGLAVLALIGAGLAWRRSPVDAAS
jgi:EmrB/QacA subfamily drug resistance transporter